MPKAKAPELIRFGENVRKRREEREWTQEQLAEKADLDQTFISGIERGARNPTIITINKLSKALKTSVSALCEGIER
ncbi:MAG: family transcriptional regulator [Rariglobus sp.]|jgi:transcriptional regulator with XRE-family HTH domain|nr:family transcriptional regulator [Rariglobus sp.]